MCLNKKLRNKRDPLRKAAKSDTLASRYWNVGSREETYVIVWFWISFLAITVLEPEAKGFPMMPFMYIYWASKDPWAEFPSVIRLQLILRISNHSIVFFQYWKNGKISNKALLENVQKYSSTPKMFSEEFWIFISLCVLLFLSSWICA